MPLVVDQLTLWQIGFKWASVDPSRLWLRIPAAVGDNFSAILEAVLSDHLGCLTLASEKYAGDDREQAKFYIRYWLDDIYAAINGSHYSRKLLKWAVIDRGVFHEWCQRRTIPLPEFWFPPGWTDYRWPEYDSEVCSPSQGAIPDEESAKARDGGGGTTAKGLRDSQIARIASQQIARVIGRTFLTGRLQQCARTI